MLLIGAPPSLAYAEMRLILARMLWNFDFELLPESRTWSSQKVRFWLNMRSRILLLKNTDLGCLRKTSLAYKAHLTQNVRA
jgi:hypothetical protein